MTFQSISTCLFFNRYFSILKKAKEENIERHRPQIWDLTAGDYLKMALEDIKEDSIGNRINAFSNAKRALHRRMDTLLIYYWLMPKNRILGYNRKKICYMAFVYSFLIF